MPVRVIGLPSLFVPWKRHHHALGQPIPMNRPELHPELGYMSSTNSGLSLNPPNVRFSSAGIETMTTTHGVDCVSALRSNSMEPRVKENFISLTCSPSLGHFRLLRINHSGLIALDLPPRNHSHHLFLCATTYAKVVSARYHPREGCEALWTLGAPLRRAMCRGKLNASTCSAQLAAILVTRYVECRS